MFINNHWHSAHMLTGEIVVRTRCHVGLVILVEILDTQDTSWFRDLLQVSRCFRRRLIKIH